MVREEREEALREKNDVKVIRKEGKEKEREVRGKIGESSEGGAREVLEKKE